MIPCAVVPMPSSMNDSRALPQFTHVFHRPATCQTHSSIPRFDSQTGTTSSPDLTRALLKHGRGRPKHDMYTPAPGRRRLKALFLCAWASYVDQTEGKRGRVHACERVSRRTLGRGCAVCRARSCCGSCGCKTSLVCCAAGLRHGDGIICQEEAGGRVVRPEVSTGHVFDFMCTR